MKGIKQFSKSKKSDFKVIIIFDSISDSLYANEGAYGNGQKSENEVVYRVSKSEYDKFLIDLTLVYEFDYIELYTPLEILEFLREMHFSIVDKPNRKELSMYSRRGVKPGKKALAIGGFSDNLSITYITWLMCIPGLSENKAIGIAKAYPTIAELMKFLRSPKLTEQEKKLKLQEIEVTS